MQMRTALLLITGLMLTHTAMATEPAAKQASAIEPSTAAQPARKLNLRLPDIRTIFSQETIDQVIAKTRDRDTIEEVEVEGARDRIPPSTPAVASGIFAPFWAIGHPTEAWRIFAPIPPDRAVLLASAPDATDLYRAAPRPRGIAIGD
jgi:hypothetical protein